MAPPKGNQFWKLRSKHGRDKIFADGNTMLEAAYEYFDWNARNPWYKHEAIKAGPTAGELIQIPVERPLTIEGLCMYWGVTSDYLKQFENGLDLNKETDKDFSRVITHIREVIRRQKIEGATLGVFNHNIVARELGLVDKQSHELSGKDGKPIQQEFNITLKI